MKLAGQLITILFWGLVIGVAASQQFGAHNYFGILAAAALLAFLGHALFTGVREAPDKMGWAGALREDGRFRVEKSIYYETAVSLGSNPGKIGNHLVAAKCWSNDPPVFPGELAGEPVTATG